MPTFASIRLHPELQGRLVSEVKYASHHPTLPSRENIIVGNTYSDTVVADGYHPNHPPPPPLQQQGGLSSYPLPPPPAPTAPIAAAVVVPYQRITTPQALLCRPPTTLRLLSKTKKDPPSTSATARPLSQRQVQTLRYEIATALWNTTKSAQHVHRVQNHNHCTDTTPTTPTIQTNDTTLHDTSTTRLSKRHRLHPPSSPPPILGTLSALELLSYEKSLSQLVQRDATTGTTNRQLSDSSSTMNKNVDNVVVDWMHGLSPVYLSTGCRTLDELLSFPMPSSTGIGSSTFGQGGGGGIAFGYVTQVVGPPGCGKTQLALSLAASLHKKTGTSNANGASVWYIYSSSPPIQRLSELCKSNTTALQSAVFATASNDHQVLQRLAELEDRLSKPRHDDNSDVSWTPTLLVIDSCPGCLAVTTTNGVDKTNKVDYQLLSTAMNTIRRITRHYHVATVLINGTVSNRNAPTAQQPAPGSSGATTTKPALGRYWNNTVCDICLWLDAAPLSSSAASAPTTTMKLLRGTLLKHTAKEVCCSGKHEAIVAITSQGIVDALTDHVPTLCTDKA